jgi:predicted permease
MDVLRSDVRDALRQLRRQPLFTLTAAFSLALGIGAPATIFALANGLLFRPLPVANQERLRYVSATSPDGSSFHSFSYPMYRALRDQNRSLAGLAAFDVAPLSVSTGGDAAIAFGMISSWNYFRVLGVIPARGRFFLPEEDATPQSHPVTVVSYAFWQGRLNGDPNVVGRSISVNGHPFTVVGVAPAEFNGTVPLLRPDLYTPIMMSPVTSPQTQLENFGYNTYQLVARLPDGAADASTEGTLDQLAKRIAGENPGAPTGQGVDMYPLKALPTEATRAVALFMAMLLTFSILILLVAGGNVASMLLARAIRRRRELAIRLAIGASRARLVRQLVTETLALFLVGAAGALAVAWLASRAMSAFDPHLGIPLALNFPIDGRVIAFTLVAAILAGLALGLVPALQGTRGNLTPDLKEGAAATSTRSRTWNVLVGAQVAFTVLLLAGAGLMARALQRAATVDIGLDARRVYLATTNLRMRAYDAVNGRDVMRRWGEAVAAQPGVAGVAFARRPPLGLGNSTMSFIIDGREVPAGADSAVDADFNSVSPAYFDVMRVPIVAGRAFGPQDVAGTPLVAIVSEAFARRWFGSASNAIDRALRLTGNDTARTRIVGVAANTKVRSIAEAPRAVLYTPIAQSGVGEMTLLARTTGPDPQIGEKIRAALRAVDPALPLMNAMTYESHIGIALIPQRIAGLVSASLGLAGLLLAATGIYGIVAYAVSQRTREIGVRVAIGASPGSVVRLMARHGMRLAAIGLATGLVVAAGASRLMTPFLLGLSPGDPVTFGAIVLVVAGVTALACLIPAGRASRVDPVVALRSE